MIRGVVGAVLMLVAPVSAPLGAQEAGRFPPDSLTNLKVFPKTIPVRSLIDSMRAFTFALGVRCPYCHVGEEGQPLSTFNFAADDKRPKRVARVMLDMVQHINSEHLADVPARSDPPVVVTCETCHRGRAKPERLQDVLARQVTDSGVDAAVALYRRLREQYYGRASFDFGENALGRFVGDLVRARQGDAALAFARLNAELFPASALAHVGIADAYLAKADTPNAVAALRTAIAKDSALAGFLGRRLRALGSGS
jgi:hypothetical protein